MRYLALFVVVISLPLFLSLLRSYPNKRSWAFGLLGLLLFLTGQFRVETYIVDWPYWPGTVRGYGISPADTLAVALVATRNQLKGRMAFWGSSTPYGLAIVMSLFLSTVPIASSFVLWQFARILLLLVAIGGECGTKPNLRGLMTGVSLGLCVQAGVVIQQKLSGIVQAPGTMPHQNILGMVVELALLPLVAFLFSGSRSKAVIVGLLASLIIVAGGGSRAALAFTFIGLLGYGFTSLLRSRTPTKVRSIGFVVLILVVVAPVGYLTINSRFHGSSLITGEEERASYKEAARNIAVDHPFGVGANMFVPTSNSGGYAARAGVGWSASNRAAPVHHAYLLARAETGWQGELAFILFLMWPMTLGIYFAFKSRLGAPGEMCLGSATAIMINVVHNNFEYAAHTYVVQALIAVNIGIIAAQLRAGRSRSLMPAPHGGTTSSTVQT